MNTVNEFIWIIATIMIFLSGIYFSFKIDFIHLNLKEMLKSINNNKKNKDGISAFEALNMSLAGRIGVGSLSGIALAIYLGGPGVLFWIWLTSILCSTNAFAESVLAVVFRKKDIGNIYRGGPFYYIMDGIGNKKLAIIYALLILVAYTCGFMTIQINTITKSIVDIYNINPIMIGIFISTLVGITIIGGVKKIAATTSKLVPLMTALYFTFCLYIMIRNYNLIPIIFSEILNSAFNYKTFGLGIISTLLIGMQKGIFSSEVGLGTGSIVSVTSDMEIPANNGMLQVFEIHFENIFIATITTFIICMSNYNDLILNDPNGIEITLNAFKYHMGNLGPIFITAVIFLFGLSTLLTGYYYGESSLKFIKKTNKFDIIILKIITIFILLIGSVSSSKVLWNITDFMVGIIAIINIYSIYTLRKIVIDEYKSYKLKRNKKYKGKVIKIRR